MKNSEFWVGFWLGAGLGALAMFWLVYILSAQGIL